VAGRQFLILYNYFTLFLFYRENINLMSRILAIVLILANLQAVTAFSQTKLGSVTGDESSLYAQTKQVNQFFRRFNNEEDRLGIRYYPGDSLYRDNSFRNVYLNMIFDNSSGGIDQDLKKEFVEQVCNQKDPKFLEFHGGLWFAEVLTTFIYGNDKENLLLFLQLEDENLGSKWVITNIYYNRFLRLFYKGDDEQVSTSFLHPMSHELDFINLNRAFRDPDYVEYYASKEFQPEYLSLLFYEIKKGTMKFESVGQVKFHFFQVDGWYFEVSFFNRPGNNSGWLISKLYKINEEEKEDLIKFYLP
jgi:hypothetical protein